MNWVKKNKVLVIFLVFAVFIGIGLTSSAPKTPELRGSSDVARSTTANSKPTAPQIPKIGTPVKDGKFEFVIKSIQCGQPTVGSNEYLTKTAQGEFCSLTLSIKNIGNEAQGLFSANQKLLNGQGQKFSADDTATLYAAPNSQVPYSNINPGNTVEGVIVFDIAKGAIPTTAELHDSAYSRGVKVSLN